MSEDSGANNQSVAKSFGPRNKHALVRAIAVALLVVAAIGGICLTYRRGAVSALWAKLQALPQSSYWDWWVGAFFGLLGLLGILVLWKVPQWQVARVQGLDSKERFDKRNEARKTLATVLGGIAFLTGGFFTWRNFNLAQESLRVSQQGQITDRFTKAVEQLGALDASGKPKLEVRLGAIYSLEAIAKDSKDLHWPIMEVLCTYVRVNAPAVEEESLAKPTSLEQGKSLGKPTSAKEHPRADIQAILTVLGRRDRAYEQEGQRLDLSKTDLRGAKLQKAHLESVGFTDAQLEGANLYEARLERAILVSADLERAFLMNAYAEGANLVGATLSGANLERTDLRDAYLGSMHVMYTDISGKRLRGADLNRTNIRGANLSRALLGLANGLTQEQVNVAEGDADTELPQGLCLPRKWEGVKPDTRGVCSASE